MIRERTQVKQRILFIAAFLKVRFLERTSPASSGSALGQRLRKSSAQPEVSSVIVAAAPPPSVGAFYPKQLLTKWASTAPNSCRALPVREKVRLHSLSKRPLVKATPVAL